MPRRPSYDMAVLRVLDGGTRFLSCREILHDLDRSSTSSSPPSLSTVYRTVHRMSQDGELDVIRSLEGERLYRRCATSVRHYHLFCRLCGVVEEITRLDGISDAVKSVGRTSGFEYINHTLELTGVCPRCR